MARKRRVTLHGVARVEQVELAADSWYTTVDGRILVAQYADIQNVRAPGGGYRVTEVKFVQLGDKWAYHCLVEYPVGSGIVVPGTDFIDLKDSAGIAKAETSAVGRALGLHGIAIDEGIASAEEMHRVTQTRAAAVATTTHAAGAATRPTPLPAATVPPISGTTSPKRSVRERMQALGYVDDAEYEHAVGTIIGRKPPFGALSQDEVETLRERTRLLEAARGQPATTAQVASLSQLARAFNQPLPAPRDTGHAALMIEWMTNAYRDQQAAAAASLEGLPASGRH